MRKVPIPDAQVVVIAAGNNKADAGSGTYEDSNTIFYFEPGTHYIDFMYTGHDSVYIGGYSPTVGKLSWTVSTAARAATDSVGGALHPQLHPVTSSNNTSKAVYPTIAGLSSQNNTVIGNVDGSEFDIGDTCSDTIGPNQYGWHGDNVAPSTDESSGGGYGIDLGDNTTTEYNCLAQNAQGAFNGSGAGINISNNEIARNGLSYLPGHGRRRCQPIRLRMLRRRKAVLYG